MTPDVTQNSGDPKGKAAKCSSFEDMLRVPRVKVGLSEAAMERERQRKEALKERYREARRLIRLEQMQMNADFMSWLATRGRGEVPSDETFARFKAEVRATNEKLRQALRYKKLKAERDRQGPNAARLQSATALEALSASPTAP